MIDSSAGIPPQLSGRRRIAVIVSRFPLLTETFILREITELERQGQPVLLVPMIREHPEVVHEEARPWVDRALFIPFFSAAIAAANFRVFRQQPRNYARLLFWVILGTMTRPGTMLKSLMLFPKSVYLSERFREEGIEHIHAHFATHPTTIAWIVQQLSGISYSFTAHAHDIFVERTLLAQKVRDCTFIRSISLFNKGFLEHLYADARGKIEVVHVGIEPDRYESNEPVREGSLAPVKLLTVAALKPYKGIPYLIEACKLLDAQSVDFQCEVVGTGPLLGSLQRLISHHRLGSRVRLRGALPQHEVARAITEADIIVLPSVVAADNQMEGIPVAIMEALAAAKPVIATAISGIPELVTDGVTGLLVDPANPRQLASAIRTLAGDDALRDRLARTGRSRVVREFALQTCVRELLAILDRRNPNDQLPQALAVPALEPYLRDGFGIRKVHERSDSVVAELLVTGAERAELVVKRQKTRDGESRAPALRAADEERILKELSQHFVKFPSVPRLSAPEPLLFDRDTATIVMTAARGATLETLIRRSRDGGGRELASAAAAAGNTGIWLARFQDLKEDDGRPVVAEIAARSIQRAEAVSLRGRSRTRLVRAITKLERQLTGVACRAVMHHGDFWPGNIFATSSDIEVIDFEGAGLSLAAADVAYFRLHLQLYQQIRRSVAIRKLERCFLAGYGRSLSPAELALCRIDAALTLFIKDDSHLSPLHRLLRRDVLRRALKT